MFSTERQHARSLYRRFNPNPLVEFHSPTLSVHRFASGEIVPVPQQSHQQLCLCTNSGDIDVLGLLVDLSCLIFSWVIFSWVIGSISLRDLLDDSGRLHFNSVH